jgi:hypothetical protein
MPRPAAAITAAAAPPSPHPVDVADVTPVALLFETAEQEYGSVDVRDQKRITTSSSA